MFPIKIAMAHPGEVIIIIFFLGGGGWAGGEFLSKLVHFDLHSFPRIVCYR